MPATATVRSWRWLLVGAIAIGTLDLVFACAYWRLLHGIPALRILQSVAAGWFGEASRNMGSTSAAVGALSHYAIVFVFVLAYRLAGRRLPALFRYWPALGAAYGLALYGAMNFVVLPLSAAGPPSFDDAVWVAGSIVVHAVIGVMCAWFARASAQTGTSVSARRPAPSVR
ncbi:MAG: hypothetical protein QM761_00230 [Pseudoxanthomonas sp.]